MNQVEQKQLKYTLKRIVEPQKRALNIALALALLAALVMIGQYALLAKLFAGWLNLAANEAVWTDYQALSLTLLPIIGLCLLVRALLTWQQEGLLQRASLTLRQTLRRQLLGALATLGPARRQLGSDGNISSQLLDQVDGLDGYISRYYVQKRLVAIVPLLIVVVVGLSSKLAAALLLLTAPLVPIFMILLGRAAAQKNRQQFQALARLSGQYLDWLRGLPTLQRLQATTQAQHSVDKAAQGYRQRTMAVLRLAFLSAAVLELFAALSIALVAVYLGLGLIGVLPWIKGTVPVAYQGALFILLLAPEFYQPLRKLGSDYHDKAKAEAAVSALLPLLSISNDRDDCGYSLNLDAAPVIYLQEVSMHAADGRLRLATCSLEIGAGKRLGLCGASGSGKSSLLQALLGFASYDGEIYVNQQALSTLNMAHWRQQIAYLSQTLPLLPLSIADNLRLANAQADDERLQDVLHQVGLWAVIAALPDGLDTPLGERGKGLSGGQLQRLALAQLLLRDASLWLLDEPTAHLDPQTSAAIMRLIGQITVGKTLILVSHDLDEVDWLDEVYQFSEVVHG